MRWLLGLVLAALAAHATAATWQCPERTEIVTTTLVMVRCRAAGTYTAGGDSFSKPAVDLCNSASRVPRAVVASSTATPIAGEGYLTVVDRTARTVVLATSAKLGADYALTEVPAGTAIDGATFTALVQCE